MAKVSVMFQRMRHVRHRVFDGLIRGKISNDSDPGVPRLKKQGSWLDARATVLDGSGTPQTFTVTPAETPATGTLTLTGLPLDTETVTIGDEVYSYDAALLAQERSVAIGADASISLDNLIAAINLDARQVAAAGVLTLTGQPLDTETVTIGGTVYTFQTALVDAANNVLIGAAATDSIDNLIAAVNAAAGAGTLYGTGTVANADASAAAGAGDTMDLTALALGPAGNSVATTETLTNGSFGDVTLVGGFDRYSVETVAPSSFVTAAAGAGDTMDVTALAGLGAAGNAVDTTEGLTNGSWGAATLAGGISGETLDITAHGYTDGQGPLEVSSTVTLPAGLSADELYFASVDTVNTIQLHLTKEEAGRGLNPVDITDAGTGTHSIETAGDKSALVEHLRGDVSPEEVNEATDVDNLL